MFDDTELNRDEENQTPPESVDIKSKYEFVMAAAKEAERLNEQYRRRGVFSTHNKVTTEAVRRIHLGASRVVYEEQPGPTEDAGKESTYFFGS